MLVIVDTNHPEYGPGQQATIVSSEGKKWRTQVPGQYLLNTEEIAAIQKDIVDKKDIMLVYREKMMNNSHRIDITEASSDWLSKFRMHETVPELEDLISSVENVE